MRQEALKPKSSDVSNIPGRLWKTRDVAEFFGVTVGTVGEWVKQGKIPPGTKIGRGRRWDHRSIQRLAGMEGHHASDQ